MTKNNVVFGPTSGRGISKTKALFGCLSQFQFVIYSDDFPALALPTTMMTQTALNTPMEQFVVGVVNNVSSRTVRH